MMAVEAPLSVTERDRVEAIGATAARVVAEIRKRIVGQDETIEELLVALLAEGHCLITGVPGLAKTLLVSTVAELLALSFKRIQFTPDLLPTDITGATIIAQDRGSGDRGFRFLQGPIFANVLLADEINRTPPKTQSALMEAMEERQVTAAGGRHRLSRPFFVLATQNPIEQEGTYPLPISQLDYPSFDEEFRVLEWTTSTYEPQIESVLDRETILDAIALARRVECPAPLVEYATEIVRASRPADDGPFDFVREWVSWGGGPRAVQGILRGAKSYALLHGRSVADVGDIHRVVFPTMRHRILLNYHGVAEGMQPDEIIERILLALPGGRYEKALPPAETRGRWRLLEFLFGR
jgi:MoxR-like ATPase